MQGDDGLPGTRTAVDHERAAGSGADDGVLVGRDGAEHVSHPGRPVAAQAGDEGGLVIQRGVPFQPVRGEHLVPVVADPAAGPAVPSPAGQAHRVGVGRPEERLSHGGAPVDQQPAARAVGEAESSHVHGLGMVRADDASEAQVQAEAAQGAQAGGQPVDLHVPVHRLLADAAGRLALGLEAAGQVGDRLLEALRDGREVLLVARDQRRVGLGGETVGKIKRAGSQGVHVIRSDLRSLARVRAGRTSALSFSGVCRTSGRALPAARARQCPRVRRWLRPGDVGVRADQQGVGRPVIGSGGADVDAMATHAFPVPDFRRFWPRPAIMRHDPGLAASPPVRYRLKMEGSVYSPFPLIVRSGRTASSRSGGTPRKENLRVSACADNSKRRSNLGPFNADRNESGTGAGNALS